MKPVARDEILDLGAYEEIRDRFRQRIIDEKKRRRVALGPNMTAVFENHDTALYQIQEMLRTERITKENAIQHEIDTYNELVPGDDELSLTIFVEYAESDERERMLTAMAGIEGSFYFVVGDERVAIQNETRGTRTDRTTAVHYAKIPLGPALAARVRERNADVVLGVEHEAYRAEAALSEATVASIAEDLE